MDGKYERMMKKVDEAHESLEVLHSVLEDRDETVKIIELDPSDPDNPSLERLGEDAGYAIRALSDVFEVVKSLAEEGEIELPSEPLPLPDAVLVTILANASLAQKAMHAEVEWLAGVMERVS